MKFYHMGEFTSKYYDEKSKKYKEFHLNEGEMSADEMVECIKEFENVDYGVLCISHINTKTNTVYFCADQV